jgi:O-antigen/teichoic acid export membrane protein
LAAIKQLAGQTLWYGVSSIGAKFLNYLLTPLLTTIMSSPEGVKAFGDYSLIYAWIAVLNILFTYGFETGFFRFSNKPGADKAVVFDTTYGSLLISTVLLVVLFACFKNPISNFLVPGSKPIYIVWCLLIIAFDTLSAIPFARLRQENRPRKYAFIRLAGIVVNILLTVVFLVYMPKYAAQHPDSGIAQWVTNNSMVGSIIMANLIQAFIVWALLLPQCRSFRFRIDKQLWLQIFKYSAPMIVIGLAGMVNEVMDRQMLAALLPLPEAEAKRLVGIYSANYKLAIFITLFIQAFKMAAEPFFFNQAHDKNAPGTYAKIMKWFVITLCIAFLFSALYLDIWQHLIHRAYRSGLGIVPILLFANICLGIYYNLSVWYKITDRMYMGLLVTLLGALITVVGNYIFIPEWGMYAAAWTTLTCYASMVVITYILGQRYFKVPYAVKKMMTYLVIMLFLFFVKIGVNALTVNSNLSTQYGVRIVSATVLFVCFLYLIMRIEAKEMKGLPIIGKFIKR